MSSHYAWHIYGWGELSEGGIFTTRSPDDAYGAGTYPAYGWYEFAADDTAIFRPPTDPGTVLFSDTFDRSGNSYVPPFDYVQRARSESIRNDSSVARKGTHSARFEVWESDRSAATDRPFANLGKSGVFCEGDETYIADSIYFPQLPRPDIWVMLSEQGFGPPWSKPTWTMETKNDELILQQADHSSGTGVYTKLVGTPLVAGKWIDTVTRVKWSKDPSVGFLEFWRDGAKQTFRNDRQRIYLATLPADLTECGHANVMSYRDRGMMDNLVLHRDEFKIGTSYSAVAP